MIKLRNLLILNGVVLVIFALGMLLMPVIFLGLFGFDTNASAKLLGQIVGVELIANGLVSLFAMDIKNRSMRRVLTLSFFIADGIGFFVSVGGVISGTLNAFGWVLVLAYLLLALGFGYFQFLGPDE